MRRDYAVFLVLIFLMMFSVCSWAIDVPQEVKGGQAFVKMSDQDLSTITGISSNDQAIKISEGTIVPTVMSGGCPLPDVATLFSVYHDGDGVIFFQDRVSDDNSSANIPFSFSMYFVLEDRNRTTSEVEIIRLNEMAISTDDFAGTTARVMTLSGNVLFIGDWTDFETNVDEVNGVEYQCLVDDGATTMATTTMTRSQDMLRATNPQTTSNEVASHKAIVDDGVYFYNGIRIDDLVFGDLSDFKTLDGFTIRTITLVDDMTFSTTYDVASEIHQTTQNGAESNNSQALVDAVYDEIHDTFVDMPDATFRDLTDFVNVNIDNTENLKGFQFFMSYNHVLQHRGFRVCRGQCKRCCRSQHDE